jgi:hypothetical protein
MPRFVPDRTCPAFLCLCEYVRKTLQTCAVSQHDCRRASQRSVIEVVCGIPAATSCLFTFRTSPLLLCPIRQKRGKRKMRKKPKKVYGLRPYKIAERIKVTSPRTAAGLCPAPRRVHARAAPERLCAARLRKRKAGDGNRTHIAGLEGRCSAFELRPHRLTGRSRLSIINSFK